MDPKVSNQVKQNNGFEENQSRLTSVTPVSKFLAIALFIIMPFLGGWVGYNIAPVQYNFIHVSENYGSDRNNSEEKKFIDKDLEPTSFYYVKSVDKGRDNLDDFENAVEVVIYDPSNEPATTSMLSIPGVSLDDVEIRSGFNGLSHVLIPDNGTIVLLSATNTKQGVFTDLLKKDPPQRFATNPYLLPDSFHKLVYTALIDDWVLYEYDFPSSSGRVLSQNIENNFNDFSFPSNLRPVYFSQKLNNLWLVNSGDSFSSIFKYSFDTGLLSQETILDPAGKSISPCITRGCRYYDFVAETNTGLVAGYHSADASNHGLFFVNFESDEPISIELPACDVWSGNVVVSTDGNNILCQTYELIGAHDYESVIENDFLSFGYKRSATNLKSLTSEVISYEEYEATGLGFREYEMSEEDYGYFMGLGLPRVAYESGEWVLGWLSNNGYVLLDTAGEENIGDRFAARERQLFLTDFNNNKTLIDAGYHHFKFVGEITHQ